MDILSPVAAAVIALFELVYEEETAYVDDDEARVSDPWALDSGLRYSLLDTRRHIRHLDSVQGIDMERQTAWMLVRSAPSGPGAHVLGYLVPSRMLF